MGVTRYKYQVLLVSLLLVLVAYPTLRGPAASPVLAGALRTVAFLACVAVVFGDRRRRVASLVIGGAAVVWMWVGIATPGGYGTAAAAIGHISAVAFQVLVLVVLVDGVHRERTVSADVIAAALCGYLLVGIAFGHAYCVIADTTPGSFQGVDAGMSPPDLYVRLTYFSFVTLTTVGFGDVAPVRDTARSLAIVEAVTGQFYLAVLVADLVGKRIGQAVSPPPPPA
jgi:voltage-gated potassium channel